MKGLLSTYSSLENGAIDMVHPNAFSDPIVVEVLKQFILEYVTE